MRAPIILYVVICLLLPALSFSRQVTFRIIKEQAPSDKQFRYEFPHFICQTNKAVATKINNLLVADFLRIDPRKVRKSIFEAVWPQQPGAMPELQDVNWRLDVITDKLLSVSISAMGCGAYCEYFTSYYSFDLKTGNLLELDQLFTKDGLQLIRDSINMFKKHKLQAAVEQLQESLKDTLSSEDPQTVKARIEMYRDCIDKAKTFVLQDPSFYVRAGSLIVCTDRCSAHYNRSLDELGDFESSFRLIDLKQYFTPYGQQLLPWDLGKTYFRPSDTN